jgi:hypothetical protein
LIPAGSVFTYLAEHRGTLKESEQEELARLRREKAALAKQHAQGKAAWEKGGARPRPAARRRACLVAPGRRQQAHRPEPALTGH